MMQADSRVYVAGHTGLIGSALVRKLAQAGRDRLLLCTHAELELTDARQVEAFFGSQRPEYVFLAAGRVGGIEANRTFPADFICQNLAMQMNVMGSAMRHRTRRLLFLASACAYPRDCPQPIRPEMLLSGPLEPTNEPFAVAKIAGIKMAQAYNAQHGTDFLCAVPATAYGPNDHFDAGGHVIASLMARFHQAKTAGADCVEIWGTGRPRREFIYVDDLAEALILLMDQYDGQEIVHVGVGEDVAIADLAERIRQVVGFEGKIVCDTSRPDGMPRRLLDSQEIRQLGWRPRTPLQEGLARTYQWYLQNGAGT